MLADDFRSIATACILMILWSFVKDLYPMLKILWNFFLIMGSTPGNLLMQVRENPTLVQSLFPGNMLLRLR